MGRDWKRLGAAFKAAREGKGLKQAELAEATGQNLSTIQNLESARYGKGFVRVPSSAHLVATYLGWTDGSITTVLDGGEPILKRDAEAANRPPEHLFADPRVAALWALELPVEERMQWILDLVKADLQRAADSEAEGENGTRHIG